MPKRDRPRTSGTRGYLPLIRGQRARRNWVESRQARLAVFDPEPPLSNATRKLPLICCPLLLEIPVFAYWQSIVWQVGAGRVSWNFYTWIFD